MLKFLFTSIILIFVLIQLSAQKKSDFNIEIPTVKIEDSKYSELFYIESRSEPENIGYSSGKKKVTLFNPLDHQLHSLMHAITHPDANTKTLAIQMRNLFFSPGIGKNSGKVVCKLRMSLYETDDEETFYYMNTIDTFVVSKSKKIKEDVSKVIVSYITDNLSVYADEGAESIDLESILKGWIVDREKSENPLYLHKKIPDGIYYNYASLKNLTPDFVTAVGIVKDKDGKLKEIKVPDYERPGEYYNPDTKTVYAVVDNGIPYIGFSGYFYEAFFKDGNWKFTAVQRGKGDRLWSVFYIGFIPVGVINIPVGAKKDVNICIDHLDGHFY